MKGNRMGVYECAGCHDEFHVSDSLTFGGGFRPAAFLDTEDHPMYWRGEA